MTDRTADILVNLLGAAVWLLLIVALSAVVWEL